MRGKLAQTALTPEVSCAALNVGTGEAGDDSVLESAVAVRGGTHPRHVSKQLNPCCVCFSLPSSPTHKTMDLWGFFPLHRAVLCRQVMAVYRGQQWAYVEEHIHDTLGKQLVAAGEGGAALPHFLAQLPCPFNSPDWQQYYLDQFLSTLQEAQEGLVGLPCSLTCSPQFQATQPNPLVSSLAD